MSPFLKSPQVKTNFFSISSFLILYYLTHAGLPPASSPSPQSVPEVPPAKGGISWGHFVLVLLLIASVVGAVILYRKPQARNKVVSLVESVWHRVPVFSRDRGRGDSTLLVGGLQEPAFGSLSDDEELLPVVS